MLLFDLPWFPLRAEASHKSEMVSSILFGESFRIADTVDNWICIQLEHDGYRGWMERQDALWEVDSNTLEDMLSINCSIGADKSFSLTLPFGCVIRKHKNGEPILPKGIELRGSYQEPKHDTDICRLAIKLLGTPYLWGGRSTFGIDCSGLIQMLYRFRNIKMPRDAYQQAEVGSAVHSEDRRKGDLAFFANDSGKISHVGLLLSTDRIIHASEKVRIDELSLDGILRDGRLTHHLHSITRVA